MTRTLMALIYAIQSLVIMGDPVWQKTMVLTAVAFLDSKEIFVKSTLMTAKIFIVIMEEFVMMELKMPLADAQKGIQGHIVKRVSIYQNLEKMLN